MPRRVHREQDRIAADIAAPPRWRILWFIKGLGVGGAEQLLRAALPFLDRSRFAYEVAYLLPHKDALVPYFRENGMAVYCLGMRWRADPLVLPRLVALLRAGRFDLVHAHLPVAGVLARLAGRVAGVPVVYTEHNLPPRYAWMTRAMNRVTYGMNEAVIAVSEEVRRGVAGYTDGRPRLLTIANAVSADDLRRRAGGGNGVRQEFRIPPGAPLIVTVGNLTPKKGHRYLLAAAERVRARHPDATFLVIGQGPLEGALREEVSRLGLERTVVLTGFRSDAPRLMAAADLFVLPSIYEGLPLVLLEAMALGKPTVATRAGGITEVASEETTLFAEPGDAAGLASRIVEALDDPAKRARLGAAAGATAESRAGMARMVRAVERVYLSILGGSQRA